MELFEVNLDLCKAIFELHLLLKQIQFTGFVEQFLVYHCYM